jgi:hypothetical protein
MPQSSPQKSKTVAPCSGLQRGVLYRASGQADASRQSITSKSLLTRFNPRLIGFGIIGVSALGSHQQGHSAQHVSAVGIFFGTNPEGQK